MTQITPEQAFDDILAYFNGSLKFDDVDIAGLANRVRAALRQAGEVDKSEALEEFDRFCRFIDGLHMGGFVENDFMSKKIQAKVRAALSQRVGVTDAPAPPSLAVGEADRSWEGNAQIRAVIVSALSGEWKLAIDGKITVPDECANRMASEVMEQLGDADFAIKAAQSPQGCGMTREGLIEALAKAKWELPSNSYVPWEKAADDNKNYYYSWAEHAATVIIAANLLTVKGE